MSSLKFKNQKEKKLDCRSKKSYQCKLSCKKGFLPAMLT